MEPMKGKWVSSRVYLGSTELFYIPEVQAVFLSSCERFLGTLWCSVKHIEAPYVFDWEHGIALHPKQGIRALTPAKGDVSSGFSSCSRNLGYILELQRGQPFETPLDSAKSGFLFSQGGHHRKLNQVCQDNTDASGSEVGEKESLSSFHRDIGISINFQEVSGLGTF